jgi:hypothetical protein
MGTHLGLSSARVLVCSLRWVLSAVALAILGRRTQVEQVGR